MTYDQAVARGRFLVKRSEADQWELAELTHDRTTGEDAVQLKVWAAAIGISQPHASRLRAVWEQFGEIVGRQSFSDCYTRVKVRDRTGELERRARRNGRTLSSEERASRARDRRDAALEALRDRTQRREILADATIRRVLQRELNGEKPRPGSRRLDDVAEVAEIRDRLYELLGGMLDRKLSAGERRTVAGSADGIRVVAEWIGSYARTGDRSFEDALEALLADLVAPAPSRRRTPPVVAAPAPAPAPEPAEAAPAEPRTRPPSTRPERRTPRERKEPSGRGGRRAS
jgi:hypothetical protein